MSALELRHIHKRYDEVVALKDINLSIASGSFFTLLGPSGCGKTTLLRTIAGFHRADAGEIEVAGQSIQHLPAHQRQVGMVFQDYAVFPHLSVFDNVAFGLVQKKMRAADIAQRVEDMLRTVRLEGLAQRMPHQLSGGQQQRVGLARALVIRPRLLLMDEPLSNLDAKLRVELRQDIRSLQQAMGITTVYVTHDQEEALAVSDQVCVMNAGVVQQVASPWDIYQQPSNRFVAGFVGANNFIALVGGTTLLGQQISLAGNLAASAVEGITAAIRPEHITLVAPHSAAAEPSVQVSGTVRQVMFTGRDLQLSVEVQGHGLLDLVTAPQRSSLALQTGHIVKLGLPIQHLRFYAPSPAGVAML